MSTEAETSCKAPARFRIPKPVNLKKRATAENEIDCDKILLKKAKLDDSLFEQEVLLYLKRQNRPYNLQNIFDNLHAAIPKGKLQCILDKLCTEKHDGAPFVLGKEYGKCRVYLIHQHHLNAKNEKQENGTDAKTIKEVTLTDLQVLQTKIENLTREVRELENFFSSGLENSEGGKNNLARLAVSELSALEVDLKSKREERLNALEIAKKDYAEYVKTHKESEWMLTPSNVDKVTVNHQEAHKRWKRNRHMALDILNEIACLMNVTANDVIKQLDLDTEDESYSAEPC